MSPARRFFAVRTAVSFFAAAALLLGSTAPAVAGAIKCVDTAFADCRVQTDPVPIDLFFGAQRDGEASSAYDAWDADIGEPVRKITFDDAALGSASILLTDFVGQDRGLVSLLGQDYFAFKTGGDVGLFPVFKDPDNRVIRETGSGFIGVGNVDDLDQPNLNLLGPGGNAFIEVNFGEGLDLDEQTIKGFGTVEAVGAFVSTLNPVTLSIFNGGDLIHAFTRTPTSLAPYFLGIVLPRDNAEEKFEIITAARFTFGGTDGVNALDGLVYTTVVDAPFPAAAAPEPTTLALSGLGLAALGLGRRRQRRGQRVHKLSPAKLSPA